MKTLSFGRAVLAAALLAAPLAHAADHLDGPAVKMDAATDITDIYAWTSTDGTKVNLVMDVFPVAIAGSKFSNAAQYVFHTSSRANFGDAAAGTANIICTFDASQVISCWGGGEYVHGDATNVNGISSSNGKLKVFAGLRDDPFFFNLTGFNETRKVVHDDAAAGALPAPNAAGCYALDQQTQIALQDGLSHTTGGPPQDFFASLNVLAIVVQIDRTLLTSGGPLLAIYGSTNK